ncbi:cell wall binding repeat-containing protein [Clostridium carnis]|uniref:Cell wall binding repeat-containing protein n=1 Tax=Clostridium carnis TaxID=1530 RepID=A0ABY6SP57_9CLOT|nr:N-acetylmuramoyl-L-alanine amidase family protein [Clostridium carnis]VDG69755.1 cell wall binding repeat-containing protein [Clostridium carnis]
MFRRSTKITSLIVAAASIATMVPAMAADVKKVDTQDGTVYNAVAYKDGKYYIDGEVEDKDEAAYYVSNGKYTDLDDVDSGDEIARYGGKYVEVDNGDYYLDLETGKVTDDEVRDDSKDDAETNLRKKIRKDNDGRYVDSAESENPDAKLVSNGFQEEWYEAKISAKSKSNGNQGSYTVYTDVKGNYIDADHNLGKINVVTTGDSVTLKNTNDKETIKIDGKNVEISAVVTDSEVIGMDKDYIYRKASLQIYKYAKDAANGDVTTSDATKLVKFGSKNNDITPALTVDGKVQIIQKISKAQDSDDIDGAKFAKTVNTYFLTNDKGEAKELYANTSVNNGKVIAYKESGDSLYVQALTLKSKNGYYYTDISDTDTDSYDAVTTDVDGNVWTLEKGYAKKYNNDDDFDKVYKVDGSFDKLSVYDKDNIIAWNEDDEVYSVVAGKSKDSDDTTTDDTVTTTTGWVQDATTGAWSYVKADGTKAIGWFQSPTSQLWYYMDANGVMQANGWIQDGGSWYFLDSTGAMKTGWVYTGGAWYFLKPTNGNKGAMQTGWIQTGGKWYYCNASGAMLSNTTVGGYVLGADGAWIK